MLAPWSWASRLQTYEKTNFCGLNHPVCSIVLSQPEQTNSVTQYDFSRSRFISQHSKVFLYRNDWGSVIPWVVFTCCLETFQFVSRAITWDLSIVSREYRHWVQAWAAGCESCTWRRGAFFLDPWLFFSLHDQILSNSNTEKSTDYYLIVPHTLVIEK